MSGFEKGQLPYSLLLDPVTDLAAAYTNNHRLIAAVASPELVAFAKAHEARRAPWDESMHDQHGEWYPLPVWAIPEIRQRCVLLWIERGNGSADYFASIPKT